MNADCVLKLQHSEDTYISHSTKLAVKRPPKLHRLALKIFNYAGLEPIKNNYISIKNIDLEINVTLSKWEYRILEYTLSNLLKYCTINLLEYSLY